MCLSVSYHFGFTPLQTYKVLKHIIIIFFLVYVLHHYKLTRFSNGKEAVPVVACVLHHYKLTRFSNLKSNEFFISNVLHHYKLTRFSNTAPLTNTGFIVLHHYKLTRFSNMHRGKTKRLSFTPLQTYKVLKLKRL